MSFAVFGVSIAEAERMAKKRLNSMEKSGTASCQEKVSKWSSEREKSAVDLCIEDVARNKEIQQKNYDAAVKELAAHYMKTMKERQISPLFSTPKIAKEFIEIARRGGAKRMFIKQKVREPNTKQPWKYTTSWKDPQPYTWR